MLSRNIKTTFKLCRTFSTQLNPEVSSINFRTPENNPLNHSASDQGKFYTVDPTLCKTVFAHGGIPRMFQKQAKTFTEMCVMVRDPALEIINYIKHTDLSKPVNRFVLYGEKGAGKSISLIHILQYMHLNDYLIVHLPWAPEWLNRANRNKEMTNSTTREGFVDLPYDAATWLIHFKQQNIKLLKDHTTLTISKQYQWSLRESSEVGSSLLNLIELGIKRIKYASDVIVAVCDEVKILSNQKRCKTFVAIDGFNVFFNEKTNIKTVNKRYPPPSEITLTIPMLELTKNDWCNGVIVLTIDEIADCNTRYTNPSESDPHSYYPRFLLRKKGFEHLDPFVPVEVPNYSEKEFHSCTSYYRDRLWLRGPKDAEIELEFLSKRNAYSLMELCAPL